MENKMITQCALAAANIQCRSQCGTCFMPEELADFLLCVMQLRSNTLNVEVKPSSEIHVSNAEQASQAMAIVSLNNAIHRQCIMLVLQS